MSFRPEEYDAHSASVLFDDNSNQHGWRPMYRESCSFGPEDFISCMMNMIHNPNLNSSWLFRADIIYDDNGEANGGGRAAALSDVVTDDFPAPYSMKGFECDRFMVRRLIPRNDRRDQPMNQTCEIQKKPQSEGSTVQTLVLYRPLVSKSEDLPFYHPKVQGIAHLHEWDPLTKAGTISVHFLPYSELEIYGNKTQKIAFHLLELLAKHGRAAANGGYVKRVYHDLVIPQQRFQDKYSELKHKYARKLLTEWAEVTDPSKHVFEDLGIAAFLIELWAEMYKDGPFPGFVDIGCGNGLLVYILISEGYQGWGFDARRRKSWAQYSTPSTMSPTGSSLEEYLLLPDITITEDQQVDSIASEKVHDGAFPENTFIISNHADELTPWTPILATISQCPFITIPCCSHNLTGEKYRAPPPRDKTKSKSTYASLVDWVARIGEDCGWEMEMEMLRIPSTRNTCLLGRKRSKDVKEVDVNQIAAKYGGTAGFAANVAKLAGAAPRGH